MPDEKKKGNDGKDEKPSGGYDSTPLHPSSSPTYTVKFTFHSASNIPVSDYGAASADPFVLAQLNTSTPTRHKEDAKLRFRSQTIHGTVEPQWEAEWIVAGVPQSGFTLKARIYDEDPGDHDDRLGKVIYSSGQIGEGWKGISKQEFKVKKRNADLFAYGLRWGKKIMCKDVELHARMVLSAEILGKTEEEVGKVYTVNSFYFVHFSPMIGRLTGIKADDDRGVERYE